MRMRVNSRGVVTIPAAIRKACGLQPGMEIDFILKGDTVYLVKRDEIATGRVSKTAASAKSENKTRRR